MCAYFKLMNRICYFFKAFPQTLFRKVLISNLNNYESNVFCRHLSMSMVVPHGRPLILKQRNNTDINGGNYHCESCSAQNIVKGWVINWSVIGWCNNCDDPIGRGDQNTLTTNKCSGEFTNGRKTSHILISMVCAARSASNQVE